MRWAQPDLRHYNNHGTEHHQQETSLAFHQNSSTAAGSEDEIVHEIRGDSSLKGPLLGKNEQIG